MREVGVLEAKTRLSELLDAVEERGETVTITRRGRVVAQLTPPPVEPRRRLSAARLAELSRALRSDVAARVGTSGPAWEELKDETQG